jgi:hypothetical protein
MMLLCNTTILIDFDFFEKKQLKKKSEVESVPIPTTLPYSQALFLKV